jgi:hypothetical protein
MGLNDVLKRHRSLAYGLAITLAAIGLWLSTRVDFMLTKNVRAIEIHAAVDSIIVKALPCERWEFKSLHEQYYRSSLEVCTGIVFSPRGDLLWSRSAVIAVN